MNSTFISHFTPSLMAPEALEAILVQRHQLADDLEAAIRESALTAKKNFHLLLGMRGIGKTHMVALTYHRISKMEDLRDKLLIAWLREEEWGVTTSLDLLLRIFRALQQEYPAEYEAKLNQQVEALYQLSANEAEPIAAELLREFVGKHTLLLLMENLDDLFDGLGKNGQKQLREYIDNYSFLTILATAQSGFAGINVKNSPFYDFFQIQPLEELTLEQAIDLLRQIARLEGKNDLESFILTSTGRDRIRAVHHLAAGNPRVYIIFSQFLTRKSLDELVEPFMRMLDDLTPYYQARMAWLSQQQRKIIEFLTNHRRAVTVKEIAQRCFITHQTTSSQLKDLREKGYVNAETVGRESFYELREPLMRFCMEVKKQRGEVIRLFVDFLRIWYTKEELKQRLKILPPDAIIERKHVIYALIAINEETIALIDKRIARQIEEIARTLEKLEVIIAEYHELNNTGDWKKHILFFIKICDIYKLKTFPISQGLVRSIPAVMSEMVSDKAAQTWLEVWRELVDNRPEFQIPLRLLNAAVRYRETKGDKRVLLELPIEERKILQQVLEIEES